MAADRLHVTKFKSLLLALKQIEPFVRNVELKKGSILENGRPLKKFGNMLPRELVGNWLLAVVGNFIVGQDRFELTNDPRGSDGLIHDSVSQTALCTEHVVVRAAVQDPRRDTQSLILQAIQPKVARGPTYAGGKTLVVFLFNGSNGAPWWPDRVAKALPQPLHFQAVWVISFQCIDAAGAYIYALTRLDIRSGHAPVWWVCIAPDFNSWTVSERAPQAAAPENNAPS